MQEELISIIIPIYKVEKYLDKCIQSVVAQTYKNLEIILVDDGSPDGCPEICDCWKERDDRIKVIHKENEGISQARNVGLAAASGKYIGFVDSDDYIHEKMYEKLYYALRSEDAAIAMCNLEKIKEDGTVVSLRSPVRTEVFSGTEGLEKILKAGSWYYIALWNKIYTREVLKEIVFPVGKIHEDEFAFHKIYYQAEKIVSIEDKLYYYIQRQGSIMNGERKIRHLDAIESICDRINFYRDKHLIDYSEKLLDRLKIVYRTYRTGIPIDSFMKNRRRVQEIDKMFKESYLVCVSQMRIKDKIICQYPFVWIKLCEIKSYMKKIREKFLGRKTKTLNEI